MRSTRRGPSSTTVEASTYPSRTSTAAISCLTRENGTSTLPLRAPAPLRMRVSMSAIGSVSMPSPTRLHEARNLALPRQPPQAEAAEPEPSIEAPRAAAHRAAVVRPHLELWRPGRLHHQACLRHRRRFLCPEGEPERVQQRLAFAVGARRRTDHHGHALDLLDLVEVDLRENELLPDAERIVSPTVERSVGHTLEVAHARQGHADQSIEEFVHTIAPQGHHRTDGDPLAELEVRDRLLGAREHGLLPRDRGELLERRIEDLGVLRRLAEPHVEHDLLEPGNTERIGS